MRALLDELDRAAEAKPAPAPAEAPRSPPSAAARAGVHFFGVRSFHQLDPTRFGWTLTGGTPRNRVIVFERQNREDLDWKLCYLYTTGVAQLTRPTGLELPRRVQQTHRDLTAKDLRSLLARPWAWHGDDFLPAAESEYESSDYGSD
jgi:hypothetical protein